MASENINGNTEKTLAVESLSSSSEVCDNGIQECCSGDDGKKIVITPKSRSDFIFLNEIGFDFIG